MRNLDSNPKISVILPVYNTQKYLKKCLDSILEQTYFNLEIICIDDGSTDGSDLILDEYAKKDERIKVMHQKNSGESNARNVGLRMMTGEYVGFVDCDDWIERSMYETLISAILTERVDIVVSTWYCDTEESSKKVLNRSPVSREVFDREELLNYLYKRDYYQGFAYIWDKLYKRELFYDEDGELMLFDEDLELGGDVLYLARLALNVKSAFYIDEAFYHYKQRSTSGSHTQNLKKREDWLEAYKRLIAYIDIKKADTNVLPWVKRFLAYHSSNVAEMAYEQGNKEVLINCQRIMKQYKTEYFLTNKQYSDRIARYKSILELKI